MKNKKMFRTLIFSIVTFMAVNFSCGYIDSAREETSNHPVESSVFQTKADKFESRIKHAMQRDAKAQRDIGVMYCNGHGVERDYEKALEWFLKAAEQGDAGAQNGIGVMYCNGHGVEQDYEKALEWFLKAAEQGDPEAQRKVSIMFLLGIGTEKNDAKAMEWSLKADKQGVCLSYTAIGTMYWSGTDVK
jgi:TPR repeat protein